MPLFIRPVSFMVRGGAFSKVEKANRTIKADVIKIDRGKDLIVCTPHGSTREVVLGISSYIPDELYVRDIIEIDTVEQRIVRSRLG